MTTRFLHYGLAFFLCSAALLAASPQRSRMEERLERQIHRELIMLPRYTVFDHLAFRVNGDTVTLQGHVNTPTLKADAEAVVKEIEGVENVVNEIEILPPSPSDDQIRRAVYYQLFAESSPLFRYGWGAVPAIHIVVKNGRVTLVGTVDNESDRTTAEALARQVPGTFEVVNNLRIDGRN